MPLDALKVHQVIQEGLSPVCGTCRHFWTARDQNRETCGKDCGGPIIGRDFPEYDGPMVQLDKFCFACTKEADYAIRGSRATRLVGVCRGHLALIDRVTAQDVRPFGIDVQSPKGLVLPVSGRYTQKTLREVIFETEKAWAEEDKNRG